MPIGLLVIYLARTALQETEKERMKLDAGGDVPATLACTAAVFGFSTGPEKGWLSAATIGSGLVALAAFVAFVAVERTAENRSCRSECSSTATGWPRSGPCSSPVG